LEEARLFDKHDLILNRALVEAFEALGFRSIDGLDPVSYKKTLDNMIAKANEIENRVRAAQPFVASSVATILALVGALVALDKYDKAHADEKVGKLIESSKEIIVLTSALADTINIAAKKTGADIFRETVEKWTGRLNLVGAVLDVGINGHAFLTNLFRNTDQSAASGIKLLGSSVALAAMMYPLLVGGSLTGPIGVSIALFVMSTALVGSMLESFFQDTYIERFLNKGMFGTDAGSSGNPEDFHYLYRNPMFQLSSYLRMILGIRLEAKGISKVVGGVEKTLCTFTLQSNHPLPAGTKIELFQAGRPEAEPLWPEQEFSILGRNGLLGFPTTSRVIPESNTPSGSTLEFTNGFHEVREEWKYEDAQPDDYIQEDGEVRVIVLPPEYCNTWHYHNYEALRGNFVNRHFTAVITLRDEGTVTILQSLISNATGIPINQIPYKRPIEIAVTVKMSG
jgi:hypothetical protein